MEMIVSHKSQWKNCTEANGKSIFCDMAPKSLQLRWRIRVGRLLSFLHCKHERKMASISDNVSLIFMTFSFCLPNHERVSVCDSCARDDIDRRIHWCGIIDYCPQGRVVLIGTLTDHYNTRFLHFFIYDWICGSRHGFFLLCRKQTRAGNIALANGILGLNWSQWRRVGSLRILSRRWSNSSRTRAKKDEVHLSTRWLTDIVVQSTFLTFQKPCSKSCYCFQSC